MASVDTAATRSLQTSGRPERSTAAWQQDWRDRHGGMADLQQGWCAGKRDDCSCPGGDRHSNLGWVRAGKSAGAGKLA